MRRPQGGASSSPWSFLSSGGAGPSREVKLFHLLALCIGILLGYTWVSFALGSSRSQWRHAHLVPVRSSEAFGGLEGGSGGAISDLGGRASAGTTAAPEKERRKPERVAGEGGSKRPKSAKEEKKRSIFKSIATSLSSAQKQGKKTGRKYHMVVTTDSAVYNSWQVQVCYYWYKRMKELHPDSDLGGFTRLLHTGRPDELMDLIPTVVVEPEPPEKHRGYKVLNRPWAFQQFLEKTNITEDYIFMSEPDHLMLKPMPNWATETMAAAFPFHYMKARDDPKHAPLIAHFNDKNVSLDKIFPTGNSPVIISKRQMLKVAPVWRDLAFRIDTYKPSKEYWGWVLEMWAFTISCSQQDPPVEFELHPEFMLQTPWDRTDKINACDEGSNGCALKDGHILHFTYGIDFDEAGESIYGKTDENGRIVLGTYRFDKREFTIHYPTLDTVKLLDHPTIKKESPLSYRQVEMIREAIAAGMRVTTNRHGSRRLLRE
ncbi:hydroxyproline O-arabinosyltransferase [Chloropicon roscoffensis]|uniref:Hydroxyproline O-arabinosyltransferase n=1 Tax=Chloropicon roscoffensis TaxID=1461544 RepID=A0AAX4PE07_9CHLO